MKCIVNLLDDEKFETELAVSSHSMLLSEIFRHSCVVMRIVNTNSRSDFKIRWVCCPPSCLSWKHQTTIMPKVSMVWYDELHGRLGNTTEYQNQLWFASRPTQCQFKLCSYWLQAPAVGLCDSQWECDMTSCNVNLAPQWRAVDTQVQWSLYMTGIIFTDVNVQQISCIDSTSH
mgnify:CR=1 FL=1